MALINRQFNGRMNMDASPYQLPPADYSNALNITRDGQSEGQDRIVTNILGNRQVSYDLPSGVNKVIGSQDCPLRNLVDYFIWNSYGRHLWLYYDRTNDEIVKVLEDLVDTDGEAVLDFNPSKKINHIRYIFRSASEGDLVLWTDGNTTPKCANRKLLLDGEYTTIKSAFIELAKMPPLVPPTAEYGTDTEKTSNALRKKLFQFSYRWEYDDFQKSSFSPYSKIALPVGIYGSDNDLDSSSNNFMTLTVESGDENVSTIEIAMRSNIGDAWSDFNLIVSLNKAEQNIQDNSTYQFLFYNDLLYPPITEGVQYLDGVQIVPLFDWTPQLAECLELANGNTPVLGAITEGYDNYPINELDVTMTVENVTNAPPDTEPMQITYTSNTQTFVFTVTGTPVEGTIIKIYVFFNGNAGIGQTQGVRLVGDYVVQSGDTVDDVAFNLSEDFINYPADPLILGMATGNTWNAIFGLAGNFIQQMQITYPSVGGGSISTEKTWLWRAQYIFGLVYEDEQNRDMPGVITFTNPTDPENDFAVNTPDFSEDGGVAQTPVISASINHLPPTGAKRFHWVRRRQTYGTFMFYMTCDFQDDPDGDGYLYFCLDNVRAYKEANSQFIYSEAPITSESRIQIIAGITTSVYNGDTWTQDYQILGTVTRTLSGGTSPQDDRSFVKVVKPLGSISPAYTANMLVMIYTPAVNPLTLNESVYWEWGESYDIYEDNGVFYHEGGDQNQTASQPATFTFAEGDVYYRQRSMFTDVSGDPPYTDITTVSVMDANYSDFFDSAVNDNGRAHVIAVNGMSQFFPVMVRFAQAYQDGTNINGINKFYFENFDEYDRTWDSIVRLFIDRRYMYVFQRFNIGVVPVLTQIVKDVQGNPLEANSDILLNKVTYPYDARFGLGNVPESFAYGNGYMYGLDNNKGVLWRLSSNGLQAISIIYECNAFFVSTSLAYQSNLDNGNAPSGGVYAGNPTAYGTFNSFTNKYIIAFEEINRYNAQGSLIFHQDPVTISFNEVRDSSEGFESRYSFYPENMTSLNNLLISFKNGAIWKHDSDTRCNFYGIQYNANIEVVFNDSVLQKKSWAAITEISNTIWDCPLIYTNVMSYGIQRQESVLIEQNFKTFEQYPSASILRDRHSSKGIYNGDFMKGGYMVVLFNKTNARDLVILSGVSMVLIDSPLTGK